MRIAVISWILLLVGLTLNLSWAQQETSAQNLFEQGAQSYLAKDYAKALENFQAALQMDPHNSSILTNLSLAQFQLGNKTLAVGYLRRALAIEPELETAQQALKFILSQLSIKDVPHQISLYENVRLSLLQPVSIVAYLVLAAILMFAAGWSFLNYAAKRRAALQEESTLPSFPFLATLFSLGFILFVGLLSLKIHDSRQTRGTIIPEQVSIQTAPGANLVSILELSGGTEVLVLDEKEDWAQIEYPGSIAGWIKKSDLVMTR